MKISKLKNLFVKKEKLDTDALLNDIFSLVIQVEEKYNKVDNKYKKLQEYVDEKIKNEEILHALVQISNILRTKELECDDLQGAFDILINILSIDKVFVSKIINKTFAKKTFEWQLSDTEMMNENVQVDNSNSPELFEKINSGLPFIFSDKSITREFADKYGLKDVCCFPLFVSGEVWGMIGFISYKGKDEWASGEINICGLLSSLFSTYVQNKTLIAELNKLKDTTNG